MDENRANVLGRIEPQPPLGIKYMLGDETWLPLEQRSPMRLLCEEWGNLGPMILDPEIEPNAAGFRVRTIEIPAPTGALGFARVGDDYFWTSTDQFGRTAEERSGDGSYGREAALAKGDER